MARGHEDQGENDNNEFFQVFFRAPMRRPPTGPDIDELVSKRDEKKDCS